MDSIKELLGLPKYTVPLFGMTVGIPVQKNEIKPRLPKKNISFKNRYEPSVAVNLDSYNQQTREYYANRSTAPQIRIGLIKCFIFLPNPKDQQLLNFLKNKDFHWNKKCITSLKLVVHFY
jgi:FMN reductase (NADPH)